GGRGTAPQEPVALDQTVVDGPAAAESAASEPAGPRAGDAEPAARTAPDRERARPATPAVPVIPAQPSGGVDPADRIGPRREDPHGGPPGGAPPRGLPALARETAGWLAAAAGSVLVTARRRPWLLAALVGAVAVLVVVAVLLTNAEPGGRATGPPPGPGPTSAPGPATTGGEATADPGRSGQPSPTGGSGAAPSAAASPAPSAAPTGTAVALPRGWRIHRDPTGFSVAVPASWPVSREGTIVYFREQTGQRRVLGIDQSPHPKPDPVADWRQQEGARLANGDFPAYWRVKIAPVDYFVKAADWEYTYQGSAGARLHVVNRGFIASRNQAHAIFWLTPDATWRENLDEFDLITRSFVPIPERAP
ncbi:MAG TPA: hypothetical protein VNV66_00940, partial [Pilimelia sp.]|nr:hypothetical protein [Pilimelia sp.]